MSYLTRQFPQSILWPNGNRPTQKLLGSFQRRSLSFIRTNYFLRGRNEFQCFGTFSIREGPSKINNNSRPLLMLRSRNQGISDRSNFRISPFLSQSRSFWWSSRESPSSAGEVTSTDLYDPPSLAELSSTLSAVLSSHSAGFFAPLSRIFLFSPDYISTLPFLVSSPSYLATLFLLLLSVRLFALLPVSLWQRARMERFVGKLQPDLEEWTYQARPKVVKEARTRGMSYEQYVTAWETAVKTHRKMLYRIHRCSPFTTMFLLPTISIPILLFVTFSVRQAAFISQEVSQAVKGWLAVHGPEGDHATEMNQLSSVLEHLPSHAALDPEVVSACLKMADSVIPISFFESTLPSLLSLPSTPMMPLAVGLLGLLGFETTRMAREQLEARIRKGLEVGERDRRAERDRAIEIEKKLGTMSKEMKDRVRADRAAKKAFDDRHKATDAASAAASAQRQVESSKSKAETEMDNKVHKAKGISQGIRLFSRTWSFIMVAIAASQPYIVILYWAGSSSLTVLQNLAFMFVDRRKLRAFESQLQRLEKSEEAQKQSLVDSKTKKKRQ